MSEDIKKNLNDMLSNPDRTKELFERYLTAINRLGLKRARKDFLRTFDCTDWTHENLRELAKVFERNYSDAKIRYYDERKLAIYKILNIEPPEIAGRKIKTAETGEII